MWTVQEYYTNGEVGDYGPFKSLKEALVFAADINLEEYVNIERVEVKKEE